jgi:hypothetical protein
MGFAINAAAARDSNHTKKSLDPTRLNEAAVLGHVRF